MTQEEAIRNYRYYGKNAWAFLRDCVYTLDQVDKINPIKTIPEKQYLQMYSEAFTTCPLLAVPKSRRMTMSWTTIGLIVWDSIFHSSRSWAMVSKKEDDADELVKRAKFIFEKIPEHKIPRDMLPKIITKKCYLEFSEMYSKIQGFPQGADQLRQFTFSGIFGDESAFWEDAQAFYSASFPTIDGGGQMVLVSSPFPGFFKKLVFDALDEPGDFNQAQYEPEHAHTVSQGVRLWKNKRNKFTVFELHYSADPEKRHDEYRESLKASLPLQDFLREYELYWDTFKGQPVFPEFSKDLHVIDQEPSLEYGLPMLIGFDFGLTPAALVAQFQGEQLVIFKEYVETNMGIDRFSEKVLNDIHLRWPEVSDVNKWECFIDPSGDFRKDTDENTCARILVGKGFRPRAGPVAFETRRLAVTNFLNKITAKGPAFQIYRKGCPMAIKGLEGGYRYSDKHVDLEPTKLRPIKDAYSHPMDALQYICSGIHSIQKRLKTVVPKPQYSFLGEKNA